MFSLARTEFLQIFRNRMVLFGATIIPVGMSALFIVQRDIFASAPTGMGLLAGAFMALLLATGLYATLVTTISARRQTLFLKRLRSTSISDSRILAGLVLPPAFIGIVQVTAVLSALAFVSDVPANIPLLVLSGLTLVAMMVGLALATAGVTKSPEHAQVTTLPISMAIAGVAFWVGYTGTESLGTLKSILPGGAAAKLTINAWNGGVPLVDNLLLLLPSLAWVWIGVALASRMFRWEPRH